MDSSICKVCMCDIKELKSIAKNSETTFASNEVQKCDDSPQQLCPQCLAENKIVIKTEYEEEIEIEETEILNVNEEFVKSEFDFECSDATTNNASIGPSFIDFERNPSSDYVTESNSVSGEDALLIPTNLERPKSYIKTCFVPTCRNDSYCMPDKLFFAVPKKYQLRKSWFKAVGREFTPTTNRHCCEDHFDLEKDSKNLFKFKLSLCKHLLLKPSVVPHKFLTRPNNNKQAPARCKHESEDSDNELLSEKLARVSKRKKIKKKLDCKCSEAQTMHKTSQISLIDVKCNPLFNVDESKVSREDALRFRTNVDEFKNLDRLNIGCKMCFVPICKNNSYCAPVKLFLAVPKKGEIRSLWFEAVGRKFSRTTNLHCCEDHFNLEEDSTNWLKFKLSLAKHLILKSSVVPHKYINRPNTDVDHSQFSPPKWYNASKDSDNVRRIKEEIY